MILRKRKNSSDIDSSQVKFCEFNKCNGEIFSSCHICNSLLCFNHFADGSCCKDSSPPKLNNTPRKRTSECEFCGRYFSNIKLHKCKQCDVNPQFKSQPMNVPDDVHILLASLKSSRHVIKRIPKAARLIAASTLSKTIDCCIKSNDLESWNNLLIFAYKYLHIPSERKQNISITSIILKNFKEDPKEVLSRPGIVRKKIKNNSSNRTNVNRIIGKVSDGDLSSAVRLLSSKDTLANFSETTKSLLQAKHPPGSTVELKDIKSPEVAPLTVTKNQVLLAVKSFNPGSAGGLDSLRPSHIQDMLSHSSGSAGECLLNSLTSLCNFILSGKVSPSICPILFGGSLCALTKKDGGIRPIAVGNFFRRLVGKLCCFHLKDQLGEFFRPRQFGFGTRGGCEAVVHSAVQYLFHNTEAVNEVFLKLDFRNAFNTINRNVFLTEVAKISPDIFPFVFQCYSNPSFLMFGKNTILSQSGVQQGDPLGPMLFCLSINNLINSLNSKFNTWYLDDGSLGDKPDVVYNDLKTVIEHSKSIGLELNFDKCELFFVKNTDVSIISKFNSLCPNIRILEKSDLFLLGSPLNDEALNTCMESKKKQIQKLLSGLFELPSHIAYVILKHCFSFPKFIYSLRCYPSWHNSHLLEEIDNMFRLALEKLCNNIIDQITWKQASLPVDMGGLGIRSISSLSLPCFLSSFAYSKNLIESILSPSSLKISDKFFCEGLEKWQSLTGFSLPECQQTKQKAWDRPLLDLVARNLLESASTIQNKARLLAVSSCESGAWLNAHPVSSLGTLLDNEAFRIAVGLRLGTPICAKHFCKCGFAVDELGLHALSCRFNSGRLSRHHEVNTLIKRALHSAEIPAILEPVGTSRDDGKRPDGMTLIPWKLGRPAVWDFTCLDTMCPSHIQNTSKFVGSAALSGETNKIQKYQNLQNNYLFYPLAIETFGVWGKSALNFIKNIGRKMSEVNKDARSTSFLIQKISIAVQRGNAASVLGNLVVTENYNN